MRDTQERYTYIYIELILYKMYEEQYFLRIRSVDQTVGSSDTYKHTATFGVECTQTPTSRYND